MKHGKLSAFVAAGLVAVAVAPAAQAAQPSGPVPSVCNEATPHSLGGALVALPGDPQPPARYLENLVRLRGLGVGLVNAAGNSPALQVCAPAAPAGDPTGGSGGSGGGLDVPPLDQT